MEKDTTPNIQKIWDLRTYNKAWKVRSITSLGICTFNRCELASYHCWQDTKTVGRRVIHQWVLITSWWQVSQLLGFRALWDHHSGWDIRISSQTVRYMWRCRTLNIIFFFDSCCGIFTAKNRMWFVNLQKERLKIETCNCPIKPRANVSMLERPGWSIELHMFT